MRRPAIALALAALLAGLVPAESRAAPENITPGEMAMLPPYCPDTIPYFPEGKHAAQPDQQHPRVQRWTSILGTKPFSSLHHYCWALINASRARFVTDTTQRNHMLSTAIADCIYVLANSGPEMLLRPEILLRIGEYAIQLGRYDQAHGALLEARQLKPDYWPAYARWAEVLAKIGKKAEARELVATGLSFSGAPALKKLYRELGGDPDTVPLATPPASAPEASAPASAAGDAN